MHLIARCILRGQSPRIRSLLSHVLQLVENVRNAGETSEHGGFLCILFRIFEHCRVCQLTLEFQLVADGLPGSAEQKRVHAEERRFGVCFAVVRLRLLAALYLLQSLLLLSFRLCPRIGDCILQGRLFNGLPGLLGLHGGPSIGDVILVDAHHGRHNLHNIARLRIALLVQLHLEVNAITSLQPLCLLLVQEDVSLVLLLHSVALDEAESLLLVVALHLSFQDLVVESRPSI
mmetsp:Transcript_47438/g.110860  ORF Transcript_47438/g.110860 Transcript_47438/m.110860 type:complete len:232 (-) Transcript_47438:202-897(-)